MTDNILQVIEQNGDLVVDSRLIALKLDIEHESFMRFVVAHFGQNKASLSILDLLGIRARCFTYSDYDLGFKLDKIIELIIESDHLSNDSRLNLTWMFAAIKYEATNNWKSTTQELGGVHVWFRQNHRTAIPDSKLVKVIARDKKRPDFLVRLDDSIYPVECKIEFTNQSLKQLRNYMRLWNSRTGFAVAYSLKCTVPSNITFVQAV